MNKYFELIRPRHLLNNAFIFLIGAAFFWKTHGFINNTILGLIAFLLTYATVYINNDLRDIKEDQHHPIKWKRERPIPSGEISPDTAKKVIILLGISGLTLSAIISLTTFLINSALLLLNLIYSALRLKHQPIIGNTLIAGLQLLKLMNGWLVNQSLLHGMPLFFFITYSGIYSTILSIYKKQRFKSKSNQVTYMVTIGLIALASLIISSISNLITQKIVFYLIILGFIGGLIAKSFSDYFLKNFQKGINTVLLVNIIILLLIITL